jgi:hypothetical protein
MTIEYKTKLSQSQLILLNSISETIVNVKSLATVATGCDLQSIGNTVLYDYLNAMNHLLSKAEKLCEELIETFYEIEEKTL